MLCTCKTGRKSLHLYDDATIRICLIFDGNRPRETGSDGEDARTTTVSDKDSSLTSQRREATQPPALSPQDSSSLSHPTFSPYFLGSLESQKHTSANRQASFALVIFLLFPKQPNLAVTTHNDGLY